MEEVIDKPQMQSGNDAPPFVPSTADLPPALDDAAVRAAIVQAEKDGSNVANMTLPTPTVPQQQELLPQTPPEPKGPEPATPPSTEPVPDKFKKPDGTVDVEKLKASTEQLQGALQQKQEAQLSVDEMVRKYKEMEKQLHSLPNAQRVNDTFAQMQNQGNVAPPAVSQYQPAPDESAMRERIRQELEKDPVGTIVDLAKAIAMEQQRPFHEFMKTQQQQARDTSIRNNLSELAKQNPDIVRPEVYQAVLTELNNDPGYWHLRNPHEAAWLKVKGQLRLGEHNAQSVQPSKPSAPILGGGSPPPVPSNTQPFTPQNLMAAIPQAKPGDEEKRLETAIRDMTNRLFRAG